MKHRDFGLLVLRLGFAGMMLTHGIPKINNLLESPIQFSDPIGIGEPLSLILALIGEVVAPILIILGLKTRLAAVPALITMLVAAFVVHDNDPIATKEKALLYAIAFLVLMISGGGKYSVSKQ